MCPWEAPKCCLQKPWLCSKANHGVTVFCKSLLMTSWTSLRKNMRPVDISPSIAAYVDSTWIGRRTSICTTAQNMQHIGILYRRSQRCSQTCTALNHHAHIAEDASNPISAQFGPKSQLSCFMEVAYMRQKVAHLRLWHVATSAWNLFQMPLSWWHTFRLNIGWLVSHTTPQETAWMPRPSVHTVELHSPQWRVYAAI